MFSVISTLGKDHIVIPNGLGVGVSNIHGGVEVVSVVYLTNSICRHGWTWTTAVTTTMLYWNGPARIGLWYRGQRNRSVWRWVQRA